MQRDSSFSVSREAEPPNVQRKRNEEGYGVRRGDEEDPLSRGRERRRDEEKPRKLKKERSTDVKRDGEVDRKGPRERERHKGREEKRDLNPDRGYTRRGKSLTRRGRVE